MSEAAPPPRPAPVPDDLTRPFWEAARAGRLAVQRCQDCGRWAHPPTPFCHGCGSTSQAFEPVSGRARALSTTATWSGARHPYFAARQPYLVAVVELVEQPGLLLYTNLPGSAPETPPPAGTEVEVTVGADGIPEFTVPTGSAP